MPTIQHMPTNETEFLKLRGDFTESVKLSFRGSTFLNGWYLFERLPDNNNRFVRKDPEEEIIDIVMCRTQYLSFGEMFGGYGGIYPHHLYYEYITMNDTRGEEYDTLREKLRALE